MTLVYPPDDFEAFLTAILETWVHRSPEWTIVPDAGGWFPGEGPVRAIVADPVAARRVSDGLIVQAGEEAWLALGQAFRHGERGKETCLAAYVRACIRYGRSTLEHLTDSSVKETLGRARAVRSEAHRF